ncbi:hypothetical protein SEA_MAGRITTE_50 [Microbacterium phage Magritte]|nr:hypothetical protein SEA_MAGRITTE_50 [Microbacterium phage Magritte]
MALPGIRSGHKPAPFVKPGITLSTELHGSKKRWVKADPRGVGAGDIIRGAGLVVEVYYKTVTGAENEAYVVFRVQNGSFHRVDIGDTVIAFTEAEGEPVG